MTWERVSVMFREGTLISMSWKKEISAIKSFSCSKVREIVTMVAVSVLLNAKLFFYVYYFHVRFISNLQ